MNPPVSTMRSLRFLLVPLALTACQLVQAFPVFPGAVGFGSHTVAGRGGQVYRVTNLNNSGPGSLRYGVQNVEGPRVIIFDVSGVIELESDLVVKPQSQGEYGYLTIAGQTAPPPGITLKNAGISVQNHDVLIQHLAIRPGTSTDYPNLPRFGNRDAIKVGAPAGETTYNVVIDHVSCSWALDETASTWSDEGSVHDVAFINSSFSDPIRHPTPDKNTGYGVLGGRNTYRFSVVGNVMAFNLNRSPLIRDTILNTEVVNNFVYRPHYSGNGAIYFGFANPDQPDLELIASVAGNVIIRKHTGTDKGYAYSPSTIGIYVHDGAPTKMSIYLANNSVYNPDLDRWFPSDGDPFNPEVYRTGKLVPRTWTSNPFPYTRTIPWMDTPDVIENRLLASAGKHPAFRDAIDQVLFEKIRTRTGDWIEKMEDLGPDPWASADVRLTRRLELPANPNEDDDNDGYTNLEEWLHGWSAYVEGRAAEPPTTEPADPSTFTNYQTPGVFNGLPAFYQRLLDRVTHPMSWLSGQYNNFAKWRRLAQERVRQAWMNPPPPAPWNVTVVGEEDRGSYVARKLVLNISADSRILAYLTVPKGEGPFPGVLLLHSHGGNFSIGKEKNIAPFDADEPLIEASNAILVRAQSQRHVADKLSERGYVVFTTDAILWGERGGGGSPAQEVLASNLMHFGMSFAGLIAWEDLRAADFLSEQPKVDTKRIAAMGLSVGAYRTWQVAAISDKISAGVAICWMGTAKSMFTPGMNQTRGNAAYSMLHPGLLVDLDYPDIASIAAPKPMLFYNGRFDRLFPQSGVEDAYAKMRAVWESQGAGDRLETRTWPVEHKFTDEMQEAAFDWLDRMFDRAPAATAQ